MRLVRRGRIFFPDAAAVRSNPLLVRTVISGPTAIGIGLKGAFPIVVAISGLTVMGIGHRRMFPVVIAPSLAVMVVYVLPRRGGAVTTRSGVSGYGFEISG